LLERRSHFRDTCKWCVQVQIRCVKEAKWLHRAL
jgi:hypothetical protein